MVVDRPPCTEPAATHTPWASCTQTTSFGPTFDRGRLLPIRQTWWAPRRRTNIAEIRSTRTVWLCCTQPRGFKQGLERHPLFCKQRRLSLSLSDCSLQRSVTAPCPPSSCNWSRTTTSSFWCYSNTARCRFRLSTNSPWGGTLCLFSEHYSVICTTRSCTYLETFPQTKKKISKKKNNSGEQPARNRPNEYQNHAFLSDIPPATTM